MFIGNLGEPYCSNECLNNGKRCAESMSFYTHMGVCGFCQKPIRDTGYGTRQSSAIPFEGKTLYVCPNCTEKAKQYMKSYHKCCMCQKTI